MLEWFVKNLFLVYRQFVFLRTQFVAELVAEIKAFLLVESALFAKNNFLIVLDFLFQELAYSELV